MTKIRSMRLFGAVLVVCLLALGADRASAQGFCPFLAFCDAQQDHCHHNCRALVPGGRQLSDEQIRALIRRQAVIGVSCDNRMLRPGWKTSVSDVRTVSLTEVIDHFDHICQLAGNVKHCGIGSDLDGGFGKEETPHDVDTIADLRKIAQLLAGRSYRQDDIDRIMWRNFVDFFKIALPSRTPASKLIPGVPR